MRSLFRMSAFSLLFISLPAGVSAQNKLFIDPQTVKVGDTNVLVPILLDNDQPLYGFSLSLATNVSLLKIKSLDLTGTPISDAGWSFGQVLDGGSRISWGVVLDITDPFDLGKTIPVGKKIHIANLVVDVAAAQGGNASISFQDVPASPPVPAAKNTLVGNQGTRITAFTTSPGAITIMDKPMGALFHRGDSDNNGELQLTDAVRILGFLFLGGTPPTCFDAADADNNGQLQLTDAVRILGFLFLGQASPAPPGPPPSACGVDPDEVHLGCATYTHC